MAKLDLSIENPVGKLLALLIIFALPAVPVSAQEEQETAAPEFEMPADIEFELPPDMEDFGEPEFEMDTKITQEEAAQATLVAMLFSSVCSAVPAFLLGGVIGYFIGRSRGKKAVG